MTQHNRVLSIENLIPLSNLGVLLGIAIGGAFWVSDVRHDIKDLKVAVQRLADGEWNKGDMRRWATMLEFVNRDTTLVVPQVD